MKIMDNSAFPHRNAFCTYQFIVLYQEKDANSANKWLITSYNVTQPYTFGSYVGYCNHYTGPKMYFLQNFKKVKYGVQHYDPNNIIYKAYDTEEILYK